jgi:DNA (cytosine-5)-methyltransferase 1
MGTGGNNVPIILTDHGFRKLTPAECFEFQGFPVRSGEYILPDIAHSHLYKQAGNSVSVPVIQAIAENIMKALEGEQVLQQLSLF